MKDGGEIKVSADKFGFQIIIESPEIDRCTDYLQKRCSVLYNELNKNLTHGSIEPLTSECGKNERGADIIFYVLLVTNITFETFDRMYDLLNIWLEYNRSCKVTLKYKDGSIIELTHLSKTEALKLVKDHQQRNNG